MGHSLSCLDNLLVQTVRIDELFHPFAQVASENIQAPPNEMQFADRNRDQNKSFLAQQILQIVQLLFQTVSDWLYWTTG